MSGGTYSYDPSSGSETYTSSTGYIETTTPDYRYGGYVYSDSRHPGATYTNSDGYSYYNPAADNPDYD